jgi:hypothetical protein
MSEKPLFIISCYENPDRPGDYVSNGGIKVYNHLATIINASGLAEAFVATHVGRPIPWMVNHAPHCTWEWATEQAGKRDVRIITGWLGATPVLELAREHALPLFYIDCELVHTIKSFRHVLDDYLLEKMSIATNSRHQQAWYMAEYGIKPPLIWSPLDTSVFYPGHVERKWNRIAFFFENHTTPKIITALGDRLRARGTSHEFTIIRGNEQQVADLLRTCNLYAGIKPGKHPLWGEGYDYTVLEAMGCGVVPVSFDLNGNRENLIPNFNGILVKQGDINQMAHWLERLLVNPPIVEQFRQNAVMWAHGHRGLSQLSPALLDWLQIGDPSYAFT